jgi:Na+/H+-translocating membrane pyrophosphatase
MLGQIAASLEGGIVALLLTAFALSSSYFIGATTGLASGGTLGLIMALAGMGSVSSFMLTLSIAEPLAGSVMAIASLRLSEVSAAACAGARRIHQAATASACSARVFFAVVGSVAALLAALAGSEASTHSGGAGLVAFGVPTVLWGAALGTAAVFGYCGLLLRAISTGTNQLATDVSRQLAATSLQSDATFTPDYKSPLDIATAAAVNQARVLATVAIAVPVGFTVFSRLSATTSVQSVLAFVTLSVLAALCVGLGSSGLAMLSNPNTLAAGPTPVLDTSAMLYSASGATPFPVATPPPVPPEGRIFLLFDAVAPTAQLFAKSIAIVCLMLSPFIF